MKSSQSTGTVVNKRLLALVLCSITSIFLIKGLFTQGTAQSNEPQAQERNLKIKDFKDMPVIVREVRNLQSETWHSDLEIELRNVSNKPIYFILAYLIFPDDKAANGDVGIRLMYGSPQNIRIKHIADPKDLHLNPGETYIFTVPIAFRRGFEARHKKYSGLDRNMVLRFALISFGDGTGFEVGEPRDLRFKKSSTTEAPEGQASKKAQRSPSTHRSDSAEEIVRASIERRSAKSDQVRTLSVAAKSHINSQNSHIKFSHKISLLSCEILL